jgi:hypothetical protein
MNESEVIYSDLLKFAFTKIVSKAKSNHPDEEEKNNVCEIE